MKIEGDLRAALTDFFAGLEIPDLQEELDRIEKVVGALDLGDRATFRIHATPVAAGEIASFEVEIERQVYVYVRVRGTGTAFRIVREAVEAYWRESLIDMRGDAVELSLLEARWPRGSRPALHLAYSTIREFSCLGFHIETELRRRDDWLTLDLLGISPPGGPCPGALGPATGRVELDLPPGTYRFSVRNGWRSDYYLLEVTDSTAQMRTVLTAFSRADTLLHLLIPENSFALFCGTSEVRQPLCERLRTWIARRDGISVHEFPPAGVVPYRRGGHAERSYFRYEDAAALGPIRSCFAGLAVALEGLSRIHLTAELWTAELITPANPGADSGQTDENEPAPPARESPRAADEGARGAKGPAGCLPTVPPPAADRISLSRSEARPYSQFGRFMMLPCRIRARLAPTPRADPGIPPEITVREDSTVRITLPIGQAGPDRWRAAVRRKLAEPAFLAPRTSRSAALRAEFHRELRNWQCRLRETAADTGETVGDTAAHPLAAWVWVEHGGDWYYLLSGTTAEAVDAYLTLVDTYGEELTWSARETEDGEPERVGVGPGRVIIPGFHLYRWRP